MRLHVVDHPLVSHKLTTLRDQETASPEFRRLTEELVTLLAYEATRDVRVEPVHITTPVAPDRGRQPEPTAAARRPDPAGRPGHARGDDAADADGRGRLPRDGPQRGDARGLDVRRTAAGRPVRAPVLRARPDARHRRHPGRRDQLPHRPRRRPHHLHLPAGRARGRAEPRERARRGRRAGHGGDRARSTSGSTRRATSCRASATPATGSTAWPSRRPVQQPAQPVAA